jgi:hypothetical protein
MPAGEADYARPYAAAGRPYAAENKAVVSSFVEEVVNRPRRGLH